MAKKIFPPHSVIPAGTVIHDFSSIGHHCTFGDGCTFGDSCFLGKGCTFGDDCTFGKQTYIMENCTFGQRCIFGEKCNFQECITFGKGCRIGKGMNSGGAFSWKVDPSEGEEFAGKSFFENYAVQLGMSGTIQLADINGKIFTLPRTPSVEQVQQCLEYIAAVEKLAPRKKLAVRAGEGDHWKMTRKQIWERDVYEMKHDVEQWKLPHQGYISTEALAFAAVLCGAKIKSYRTDNRCLLHAEFVPPVNGGAA